MIAIRNTTRFWGAGAQLLHWLMAAGIATSMVLGWVMVNMPAGSAQFRLYALHKSLGITLLALVALRLVWRWINVTPPLPDSLPRHERWLAKAGHRALYALMLLMPLSGYVINSAANFPLNVFGLVQIPNLTPASESLGDLASNLHLAFFWGFVAVLTAHIGGALRHHFVLRDNILRRMLPGRHASDDRSRS
ncbi:cytochrome b [Spiribacter roseus]|uniref:Cytochrome b n=1 Tax=Spiribacter roseus TaxID=1855875 RepID=A0ABV3RY59_9GAMM